MSAFTEKELEYLKTQRLGRLATLSADGDPHVVPVGFSYNPELDSIDIAGANLAKSKKFRDIQRDGRAAFVVDDVLPPWIPRGVEIRGHAEALTGLTGLPDYSEGSVIRIKAERIIGWGLDTHPYTQNSRKVE